MNILQNLHFQKEIKLRRINKIMCSFLIVFCCPFFIIINRGFANPSNQQPITTNYNVILIAINVLRPDHLGCYGYHRNTSPTIDKLAKESFIFKNAFAQAGYTLPSMMSIITSLYPESHGMMDVYKDKLSSRVRTIAEILRIYGYKTAWFSTLDEPHLSIEVGFERGFENLYNLDRKYYGKEQLLSWIKKNRNEKIFIAMNIRNLHSPYYPLNEYIDAFRRGEKGLISSTREEFYQAFYFKIIDLINTSGSIFYTLFGEDTISHIIDKMHTYKNDKLFNKMSWARKIHEIRKLIPPEEEHKLGHIEGLVYKSQIDITNKKNVEYLASLYDACILGIDQELIKPIIATLKDAKIYDNTMVIITADHGETFGEHRLLFHGFHFYDEVIHVPLIIKIPFHNCGKEITELVQSIDIMPTILSYLRIEIPSHAQGKSLLPLIQNETYKDIYNYTSGENKKLAYLRSHRWKLIVQRDNIQKDEHYGCELYDLREDPAELNNLVLTHPDTFRKLREILNKRIDISPKYVDEKYTFPSFINKETQERIKKTGYW